MASAAIWLAVLALALPGRAATLVVNSSSDVANGSDGVCTLREALANAASNASTYADCVAGSALPTIDVVQFSGVSSITLTGAELAISESVEIDGPVVIDGGGVGRSQRIFHVTAGAVTLRDLTLQNGRDAGGGAILNANGDLAIHDSTFENNTATSSTGGAISSSVGDLKLYAVTFTQNAASAGDGGAVWVSVTSSDVVVSDCLFTNNSTSGGGGALYVTGTGTGSASVVQSSFLGNTSANSSSTKGGGAIYNSLAESGGLTVSLSTFDSNIANAGQGGAIFNAAAAVGTVVSGSLIQDNQAPGPGISQGFGGGLYNAGQLSVVSSTLIGNSAARSGGGLTNKAASSILAHLTNTTITGNTAGLSGGGVWNQTGSKVETRNVTISANTVVSTSYGGANVWNDGPFTALNTIVADGIGTLGCGPTGLTNSSGDGNLQYPAASCTAGPASIPAGDPKLLAPVYDGGPTGLLVVPLGAGSAAIGAGNAAVCSGAPVSGVDERGVARPLPVATTCDSGAYESDRIAGFASSPVPGSTVPIAIYAGSTGSGSVTISETGTDDLLVSFVGLSGDPELSLATPTSFTVADGDAPVAIQVDCASSTTGQFDATLTVAHTGGASPSTYTVTCDVTPPPAPGYVSSPVSGSTLAMNVQAESSTSTDVVVSETGNATLVVSSVALSGDPEISLSTSSSFQIVDGGPSETITVACSSNDAGQYSATLTVTHNATGSPETYPVTCDVSAIPVAGYDSSPAPSSALAMNTLAGTPTSTDVVVSETGNTALVVSNVSVSGDPEIALQGASSFQIADGGQSHTITVECSSGSVGSFAATLTVTHNGPGSPASYPVTCDVAPVPVPGYGSSPASGSQLTLSAIAGASDSATVTVSETGTLALVVSNVAVSGDPEITLTTPSSFQIADGGLAQDVTVFCSSNQVGQYTATLTVTHNANGSPATYPIVCNIAAAPAPGYGSSPTPGAELSLSALVGATDSTSVHVSETGTATLVVSQVAVTGDPEITLTSASSFQIADGAAAVDITVACSAGEAGEYSASLVVTHDASGSPATYPITCSVTPVPLPEYESAPNPGSTIPLATNPYVTTASHVTVADAGTAPLIVSDVSLSGDAEILLTSAAPFQVVHGAAPFDITFQCTAAAPGSYSALLTVTHNAPNSPAVYDVTCNVTLPAESSGADFDGDGHADIVWQDLATGELLMWWMDGPQRLSQHRFDPEKLPGAGWRVAGTADFNQDGYADVLLQNTKTGALRQWFLKANSKIGEANVTPSSVNDPALVVVGVGDFDGDGKPDVLRQASGRARFDLVYLNGAVAKRQVSVTPDKNASNDVVVVGVPDLDGDGKPDMLVENKGQLSVWFMNGVTRKGTASLVPGHAPSNKHHVVATADYDGDGKVDLLFQNKKDGRLEMWLMNGIQRVTSVVPSPNKEVSRDWVVAGPR